MSQIDSILRQELIRRGGGEAAKPDQPATRDLLRAELQRRTQDEPQGNFLTRLPSTIGTGLRLAKGAINETISGTLADVGDIAGPRFVSPSTVAGLRNAGQRESGEARDRLAQLPVADQLAAGAVGFGAATLATGATGGLARTTSTAARRFAAPAVSGAVTDFVLTSDTDGGNLSSILPGSESNPLAIDEDDSLVEKRAKNVAEGALLGVAGDALMLGLGKGFQRALGKSAKDVQPVIAGRAGEAVFESEQQASKFAELAKLDNAKIEPAQSGVGFRIQSGDGKPIRLTPEDARVRNQQVAATATQTVESVGAGDKLALVNNTTPLVRSVQAELGDMISRVRSAGTPFANHVADRIRVTADLAAQFSGELQAPLVRAQKAIGAFDLKDPAGSIRRLAASSGLANGKRVQIGDTRFGYSVSRMQDVLNNRDSSVGRLETSDEVEEAIVRSIVDTTSARGKLFERVGLLQRVADSDEPRPFVDQGGEIHVRFMTGEMIDIIERGPQGRLWEPAIRAFADASGLERDQVAGFFSNARDDFAKGVGQDGEAAFRRVQAEFTRTIPRVPDVLFDGKRRVELFETNPRKYVDRLVRDGAMRSAVIRNFGQGSINPETNALPGIRERFVEEVGDDKVLVEAMRALSGIPVEQPFFDPGGLAGRSVRGLNNVMGPVRALMLTASPALNIAESVGGTLPLVGGTRYVRGLARLMRHPKMTLAALEHNGATTRAIADFVFDPNRKSESLSRMFSEALNRISLVIPANEFNERFAGAAGLVFRDDLIAGNVKRGDVQRLIQFGFSREAAERMVRGAGTPDEYDAIVRRAPGITGGAPLQTVEKSRFESRRWVRSLIFFQGYAQPKVRAFGRSATTAVDSLQRIWTDPNMTVSQRWSAAHDATAQLTKLLLGTTAAGAANYFILAGLTGGTDGLKIAWNEFEDRPREFLRDSLIYTMLAGPYGAVLRAVNQSASTDDSILSGVFGNLSQAIVPLVVADEAINMTAGRGKYEGRDLLERSTMFMDRLFPAGDMVRSLGATLGLAVGYDEADKRRDLQQSIKAYWRWRFDVNPPADFARRRGNADELPGIEEIERRETRFRVNMRRAHEAMRRGEEPQQVFNRIADAVGESGKSLTAVKQSLNAKRLVSSLLPRENDSPEEKVRDAAMLQSLRDRIGEDAYRQLLAHDFMINQLVSTLDSLN